MAAFFQIFIVFIGVGIAGMVIDFIDVAICALIDVMEDKRRERESAKPVHRHRVIHR